MKPEEVIAMSDPGMGHIQEVPEAVWLFVAKAIGAVSGSAISLAYLVPRNGREAYLRFCVGMTVGMIFGTSAGWKIADYLEIGHRLSNVEIALSGGAFASLSAWWALGVISRFAQRMGSFDATTKTKGKGDQ